jgi:hypothetical protein
VLAPEKVATRRAIAKRVGLSNRSLQEFVTACWMSGTR